MSVKDDLKEQPYRFDLFKVLREFERGTPDKPRIGANTVVAEEIVSLGQDPFLEFPASNITALQQTARGGPRLLTRFLGFFGPQGALPLNTTVEAYTWLNDRNSDPSFVRFVDIFSNRFQQLFFRAWADARPIAQHDRPDDDRFANYVGAFAGIGSAPYLTRDTVPDIAKLPYAGLVASRIKSARRLAQLIRGVFMLNVSIVERIGSWLVFEPSDQMSVGARGCALGQDSFIGTRSYSINDKFRITIKTASLEQYLDLLPNGALSDRLADLVFFYLGFRFEYDVELSLPAQLAPPARLGVSGQLGWTAWMAPKSGADGGGDYVTDARFDLVERRRVAREAARKPEQAGAGR